MISTTTSDVNNKCAENEHMWNICLEIEHSFSHTSDIFGDTILISSSQQYTYVNYFEGFCFPKFSMVQSVTMQIKIYEHYQTGNIFFKTSLQRHIIIAF